MENILRVVWQRVRVQYILVIVIVYYYLIFEGSNQGLNQVFIIVIQFYFILRIVKEGSFGEIFVDLMIIYIRLICSYFNQDRFIQFFSLEFVKGLNVFQIFF